MEHALTASVLIVVQAERLLTGVALRGGVRLVSSDVFETATVRAAELDEDAAIALAEDARRRFPVGAALGGCLGRHRLLRVKYIFDTERVYFVYHDVNGPECAAPIEAALPTLLSRGPRARDHRRTMVAVDRP